MDAGLIDRIETNVERGASALFASAVGFTVYTWLGAGAFQLELGAYAGVAAILAFFLCGRVMRAVAVGKPRYLISVFDLRHVNDLGELLLTERDRIGLASELLLTHDDQVKDELLLTHANRVHDELVLTDEDRLEPGAQVPDEMLVLDDILAEIGPDARVVRLFDRKAMPTPGQLKSRIDNHLEQDHVAARSPDASQALSDALAELRRSLR